MGIYYLHKNHQDYLKYSLNDPKSGKEEAPPSPSSLAKSWRGAYQQDIEKLKGNDNEAKELTDSINALMQLKGKASIDTDGDELTFNKIKAKIEEIVDVKLTESLGATVTAEEKAARIKNAEQTAEREIKEIFSVKKYGGIGVQTLDSALKKLKNAMESVTEKTNAENLEKFKQAYSLIQKYTEDIDNFAKKDFAQFGTKGYILPEFSQGVSREEFVKALNTAYSFLTFGSLASKVGDAGELFGAIATLKYFYKEEKEVDKIIMDFLSGASSDLVKITGADTSRKVFTQDLGSKYALQSKPDESGNFWTLTPTQDKVDFKITSPERQGETINFSVKSYKDSSTIHILSGNIYPILEEKLNFLYHFLNLVTEPKSSDSANMYNAAKQIVGLRALIGGVRTLNEDGNIINSGTADYLLVISNTRKNNAVKVYSTKKIAQMIFKNAELIGVKPDFDYERKADSNNEFKRFSNIDVELHLAQLKNSLKTS